MNDLNPSIFIVPAIALSLVILLYVYFAKNVRDKRNYRHYILELAVGAFLMNFIWEMAQGPLYEGFEYDWKHISFCGLASIADMLMVLILLYGFGLVYKNVFWIQKMGTSKVLPLILFGTTGAILAELWHTTRGDWLYAETMPLLPMVDVGILPVLQFAILPWLLFSLSMKYENEKNLVM